MASAQIAQSILVWCGPCWPCHGVSAAAGLLTPLLLPCARCPAEACPPTHACRQNLLLYMPTRSSADPLLEVSGPDRFRLPACLPASAAAAPAS